MKFEFNSDGFDGLLDDLKTFELNCPECNHSIEVSQEDQIKQTQIEETQIELQRAQNEILQQLLHNIDTSSSSEAEAIKELQKTVEEQNKQYSQNQDTCLSVEEDNDNSKLTKDTDTPK